VDRYPVITTALDILDLNQEVIPLLDFCHLLRSPFLGGAEAEAYARACLESALRRAGAHLVRLADVRYLAGQEDKPWYCPVLLAGLLTMENLRLRHRGRQHWQIWLDFIDKQLDAMGWPGDHPDTSTVRILKDWQQLLLACLGLPPLLPAPDLPRMRSQLRWLAAEIPSSPWPGHAPVRVLTPLEAENVAFSHAWILGLDETQWPPEMRTTPFIPLGLQQQYGVPEADHQNQLQHGRRLLQNIINGVSEEVVLSYASMLDDMPVQAASLFLQASPDQTIEALPNVETRLDADLQPLREAGNLELFEESAILAWQATESPGGGHSLLADQAACPFKSFARHRLGSGELNPPVIGFPATALGNLLHDALEYLWHRLGDSTTLAAMDTASLESLTRQGIEVGLAKQLPRYPVLFGGRFRDLEVNRLVTLVLQWLREHESQRGPFRIEAKETEMVWQYDKLSLRLRIDRD
jgi:ATP-dependent helicase/nuclease subunit B